jgi:RND family efflux transporter MFP subunit
VLLLAGLLGAAGWGAAHTRNLADFLPQSSPPRSAIPPLEADSIVAEGRLVPYPGAEVTVGTEIRGRILKLHVRELDTVQAGDLLAELNAEDLHAARAEAEARIAEAEVEIRFWARERTRRERLINRDAASTQELESDLRHHDAAIARRSAAQAARDRFQAEIRKTQIVAPISGTITSRMVDPGETVDAGDQLLTITDLNRVRIEAEVDEFDSPRIQLLAPARITAEGFPDHLAWSGHVEEIPQIVVNRRLRSDDPGRPVDARVLLVKIALHDPAPLRIGQRVEIRIPLVPPDPVSTPPLQPAP